MFAPSKISAAYLLILATVCSSVSFLVLMLHTISSSAWFEKFAFDDERVANLSLEEDAGFWGGKSGEIEIIKLDGKWMEGRFSYKASSSSSAKIVEVTHGFFRVPFVTEGSN